MQLEAMIWAMNKIERRLIVGNRSKRYLIFCKAVNQTNKCKTNRQNIFSLNFVYNFLRFEHLNSRLNLTIRKTKQVNAMKLYKFMCRNLFAINVSKTKSHTQPNVLQNHLNHNFYKLSTWTYQLSRKHKIKLNCSWWECAVHVPCHIGLSNLHWNVSIKWKTIRPAPRDLGHLKAFHYLILTGPRLQVEARYSTISISRAGPKMLQELIRNGPRRKMSSFVPVLVTLSDQFTS